MDRKYNEEIRARLAAYKTANNLTDQQLANELGVTYTRINKYLHLDRPGRTPEPDVPEIERVALDVLENAPLREANRVPLFVTPVTLRVRAACEGVRRTNDVGLIDAPAGVGKTCGVQLYHREYPSSVLITSTSWRRDDRAVLAMIWGEVNTQSWRGNESRGEFLRRHFVGSNRLIICDNAHKLSPGGMELLFDFHDETGCPMMLVGNPQIAARLKSNDQLFSRIGLCWHIDFRPDGKFKGSSPAEELLKALWPDCPNDLSDEAEAVAQARGHLRALRKQIILAKQMMLTKQIPNARDAFLAAGTHLLRS